MKFGVEGGFGDPRFFFFAKTSDGPKMGKNFELEDFARTKIFVFERILFGGGPQKTTTTTINFNFTTTTIFS